MVWTLMENGREWSCENSWPCYYERREDRSSNMREQLWMCLKPMQSLTVYRNGGLCCRPGKWERRDCNTRMQRKKEEITCCLMRSLVWHGSRLVSQPSGWSYPVLSLANPHFTQNWNWNCYAESVQPKYFYLVQERHPCSDPVSSVREYLLELTLVQVWLDFLGRTASR